MQNARALQKNLGRAVCILRLRRGSGARFFHARGGEQRQKRQCCFSKRMRKVFKKNEKSMLQFCNKNSKKKRAFTMG